MRKSVFSNTLFDGSCFSSYYRKQRDLAFMHCRGPNFEGEELLQIPEAASSLPARGPPDVELERLSLLPTRAHRYSGKHDRWLLYIGDGWKCGPC